MFGEGGVRRDDFPACQVWFSGGRPGLDPRVGTGVNTSVFPLPTATCAKSALSQRNLSTFLRASRGTFLLQTAATVGYNRILSLFTITYKHIKVQREITNRSFLYPTQQSWKKTEQYNLSEAPTGVPHRYVDVPSEEAGGSARREELAHTLSTA